MTHKKSHSLGAVEHHVPDETNHDSSSNGGHKRALHKSSENLLTNDTPTPAPNSPSSTHHSSHHSHSNGHLSNEPDHTKKVFSSEIIAKFESRPSLLSSESSPARSFRGLLNLAIILLVITNLRLVILNLQKYGILLNADIIYIQEWYRWPGVLIVAVLNIFILTAYALELVAVKKRVTEDTLAKLQIGNIALLILIPSTLVWTVQPNPASGIIVMIIVAVNVMKLVSYAHVNHNLRRASLAGTQNGWPHNLTFRNLYYFIFIPTMVYQLEYPRTPSIRWGWLLRRVLEAIFFSILSVAIVEQYIIPLVHNTIAPLSSVNIIRITERLLKLSIPNLFVWLLGFYVFFHLYLNILAEILRFGDRQFYKDWWNATSLSYFWKNWNMPVHSWMLAHVYGPATRRGYTKTQAFFLCFFVSAVFHELIIGVPFQMLKMWAFTGMMFQLPAIYMTESMRGSQMGNVLFWFSIVLGQPFLVLMVYRDWYQRHYGYIQT